MEIKNETFGQWRIIHLNGELVVSTILQLRGELEPLTKLENPKIGVDLSGVSAIDSSGIGTLSNLSNRIRAARGDFAVFNPLGPVFEILDVVGFEDRVTFYHSREAFEKAVSTK